MTQARRISWTGGVALALAAAPLPAAAAAPAPPESDEAALGCLATAIAYEAAFEPLAGQQAVAEVILNRTRSGVYPPTICGVVYQGSQRRTGCQFSFTCDGSLRRPLSAAVMANTRAVAAAVLAERHIPGSGSRQSGGATHYHADYVRPYWAPSLTRLTKIGAHIFYRAPGIRLAAAPTLVAAPMAAPSTAAAAAAPAPFSPWGLPAE